MHRIGLVLLFAGCAVEAGDGTTAPPGSGGSDPFEPVTPAPGGGGDDEPATQDSRPADTGGGETDAATGGGTTGGGATGGGTCCTPPQVATFYPGEIVAGALVPGFPGLRPYVPTGPGIFETGATCGSLTAPQGSNGWRMDVRGCCPGSTTATSLTGSGRETAPATPSGSLFLTCTNPGTCGTGACTTAPAVPSGAPRYGWKPVAPDVFEWTFEPGCAVETRDPTSGDIEAIDVSSCCPTGQTGVVQGFGDGYTVACVF